MGPLAERGLAGSGPGRVVGGEALSVSKEALSKRLEQLPSALFARLFQEGLCRLRHTRGQPARLLPGPAAWAPVQEHFRAIWIVDGSTLEALKKKLDRLKEPPPVGGNMLMLVEACTHMPVAA